MKVLPGYSQAQDGYSAVFHHRVRHLLCNLSWNIPGNVILLLWIVLRKHCPFFRPRRVTYYV